MSTTAPEQAATAPEKKLASSDAAAAARRRARRTPHAHPVARRNVRIMLAAVILFNAFAGAFWRNWLGWWGWGAVTVVTVGLTISWVVQRRDLIDLRRLPVPLIAFGAWILLSTAWSAYAPETLLGVGVWTVTLLGALPLAFLISWDEFARAIAGAMKTIVGLSLLFELFVATIIRGPLSPAIVSTAPEDTPVMMLWSRDLLFEGGKIQGVLGNSIPLAFCALALVIVTVLLLIDRGVHPVSAGIWIGLGVLTLLLTRSTTLMLAAAVALAVAGLAVWRRSAEGRPRRLWALRGTVLAGIAAVILGATVFRGAVLDLLGKSEDLTGRLEIWDTVIGLAQERPANGWGWVGYWPTWTDFFDGLVVRWGTGQVHAHGAWLDLWMQVGIIGLVLFALLMLMTVGRSWFAAVDRPWLGPVERAPYRAISLLPLLLIVVLLVQSVAESRILIEEGWLIVAALAIKVKARPYEKEAS